MIENWETINRKTSNGEPFLFVIDYLCKQAIILDLPIDPNLLLIDFPIYKNITSSNIGKLPIKFDKEPILYKDYLQSFNPVIEHLKRGDSFLLNLTHRTKISSNLGLKMLFHASKAPYRLFIPGMFTVFSPETFIRIEDNMISSFPMKGTIDASIPNAETVIINDEKETDEHNTIVDLIRNDLNIVAKNVRVKRYRYIDKIETNGKTLLQVSSEITGELPENWKNNFGNILKSLLPAGSISGAPKPKTIEIIDKVEPVKRGFYTGVMGVFDGKNVDSAVMIRFISQTDEGLMYHSGGGITVNSNPESEYKELIDKVYVPNS